MKNKYETLRDKKEKHIAFNTQLLFIIFTFLCFFGCFIACLAEHEYAPAILFICICLVGVYLFLISPMYVVFTEYDITVVYLWGIRERIPWDKIITITEFGSWIYKHDSPPEYRVDYHKNEKYPYFVNGSIPKTRKTKKFIKLFYKAWSK